MNEHNPFNNSTIEMPKYRVDNSREEIINIRDYPSNSNTESPDSQKPFEEPVNQNGISKTKIININDFIFRQYIEFYPELQGLNCKENTLYLKENNEIVASEVLTFDLRTLPGEAWNVDAKTFIENIKINKSCKQLEGFLNFLNSSAYNNIILDKEQLNNQITNYMNLYFSVKDSSHYLTEDNRILIGSLDTLIANLPKETPICLLINQKLDEYFEITQEIGDTKGKGMVLELKNKNVPAIIPEEEPTRKLGKAAFVNVAIILYAVLNIGIILAIALMK